MIPSDVPGALAMGVRQPAGVVVGFAPWNAPVILAPRAVATPLAYGNTVVLKASEKCPHTHAAVVRALVDAGNLIAPTVLAGVTPAMRIYGEESFGPVVAIVAVDDPDESVRVAHDTEYGLSAI